MCQERDREYTGKNVNIASNKQLSKREKLASEKKEGESNFSR